MKRNMGGKSVTEKTEEKKRALVEALEAASGNLTAAARMANVSVRTHYRWLKEDEEYRSFFMGVKDISYGKVRDSLFEIAMKRIEKGDSAVLNQMLRLFYKNLPAEMFNAAQANYVPMVKVVIKPVGPPPDMDEYN